MGPDRPSVQTMATRGLIDGHPPGPLLPSFVEWMMGFPDGWTDLDESELSATRLSRSAPPRSAA